MRKVNSTPLFTIILISSVLMSCEKEEPKPVELKEIIVRTLPDKLDYYLLEELDYSGLVLELIWSDSSLNEIELSELSDNDISISPQNGTELTRKISIVKITHTISGKRTEFEVNVETELRDVDGNIYNYVRIGDQFWMGENLKTTKFNDGEEIPLVADIELWNDLVTPGYCWYNNDETNHVEKYGALYNWYSVETGKLCPTGWHVASNDDWHELLVFIALDGHEGEGGTALKAKDGWNSEGNGSDNYGFKAYPGGQRNTFFNEFNAIGDIGSWWTSEPVFSKDTINARAQSAHYAKNYITGSDRNKNFGLSVRCLKD